MHDPSARVTRTLGIGGDGNTRGRVGTLIGCLVTAMLIAGCGGDDEETPRPAAEGTPAPAESPTATTTDETTASGGEAPSKAAFLADANSICADAAVELADATAELGSSPSEDEVAGFISDSLVTTYQEQTDRIAALTPPAGDEETVQEIVDAYQSALDEVAADPEAAVDASDPFAEADELATAYGLDSCATG